MKRMKIAIPVENGQVNQHFGRSREFAIMDMENQKVAGQKVVSAETLQHNHEGLADLLHREKVEAVVLGGIGPYALQALEQKGLRVITGISGEIVSVAEQYARGELVSKNTVCGHHGHGHEHGHGHNHQHGNHGSGGCGGHGGCH
jgi:predicted Fe-Mo cluster-binding NifX family protein